MRKIRVAVLVSGGGTNLGALINAKKDGILKSGEIVLVVSNKSDAYALTRAKENGIKTKIVLSENKAQKDFEKQLITVLESEKIGLIILAGFMRILSKEFTDTYKNRIINVHPSLIPSFCGEGFYGLGVHKAALEAGVKTTGATVHFVNEIPDGGEIIMQRSVEIDKDCTPDELQEKVMREAEWVILPLSAEKVCKQMLGESVMSNANDIRKVLSGNAYPGRGILLGKSKNGRYAVTAYFIMGRSSNSRNRTITETGDSLKIEPIDVTKVIDPSLIIYYPLRKINDSLIVTNGTQTDTIYSFLKDGKTFEDALNTQAFEHDAPNFTPRISGIIYNENKPNFTYKLSILKSGDEKGSVCNRFTFSYAPINGIGHFIHTYIKDGDPLPSFTGEPIKISIPDNIDELTKTLWEALDEDNKISLYTRYFDTEKGTAETRLINKYN